MTKSIFVFVELFKGADIIVSLQFGKKTGN